MTNTETKKSSTETTNTVSTINTIILPGFTAQGKQTKKPRRTPISFGQWL